MFRNIGHKKPKNRCQLRSLSNIETSSAELSESLETLKPVEDQT